MRTELLYKSGRMTGSETLHLLYPGAGKSLCGKTPDYVFPGIGERDTDNERYCGTCVSTVNSNETKFRRPEVTPPLPTPRPAAASEDEEPEDG